jgi:asparagine synthase (glutamine-hydrolysing)
MCGIAALLNNKSLDKENIQKMTEIIKHRGPDGDGFESFLDGKIWFGHRRLSIIDLSELGKQPMSYDNGRYWITYNGEIYNYIEIKEELVKLGFKFKSNTDTEVILAAYSYWGKECLNKFNGMWAFIIFDNKNKTIFAARDRFGIKPLYYWISDDQLVGFGSEIKQFTVLPGWNAIMNHQRVYDFLNWNLTDHTNETLFKNVFQIKGGEALEISILKGDINQDIFKSNIYRWYELKSESFYGNKEEAIEKFKNLLFESVNYRLRADVKTGSCLSGGLDSSSIVCITNELLHQKKSENLQNTFSACSEIKIYDEREFIDEVVSGRNLDAHYTYPNIDELFSVLDDITWHQDEPFGSTSIYAQWEVFKLASDNNVKVILDGQGADELLGGYHGFFGPRLAGLFKEMKIIELLNEITTTSKIHNHSKKYLIQLMANMLLPEVLRQYLRAKVGKSNDAPDWLNTDLMDINLIDPFVQFGGKNTTISDMSKAQLVHTNLSMLLHWEDRDSMAHSVESRLPFLDYRLVEFGLGLPDEFKVSEGITKKVLREAMKGILPEKIRMRMDKMGFVTPEEIWLKEYSPDYFRDKVKEAIEVSQGILNNKALQKLDSIISGEEEFSFFAWRLISFGAWIKKFNVKLS